MRNALRKVNRYDGQVLVKRVPVGALVQYAPLVGDLQVDQTPSIVVIDGKLHGTVLAGYVDKVSINQAIADAARQHPHAHGPLPAHAQPLLHPVLTRALDRWSLADDRRAQGARRPRSTAAWRSCRPTAGSSPASPRPPAGRRLKTQYLRVIDNGDRVLDAAGQARSSGSTRPTARRDQRLRLSAPCAGSTARFNRLGVTSCAIDRRS